MSRNVDDILRAPLKTCGRCMIKCHVLVALARSTLVFGFGLQTERVRTWPYSGRVRVRVRVRVRR